jgi:hypothetical protein
MGRPSKMKPENFQGKTRCFRIKMVDGDYDDGGAYWGSGNQPVYCACNDNGLFMSTRANSRAEAKAKFQRLATMINQTIQWVN